MRVRVVYIWVGLCERGGRCSIHAPVGFSPAIRVGGRFTGSSRGPVDRASNEVKGSHDDELSQRTPSNWAWPVANYGMACDAAFRILRRRKS